MAGQGDAHARYPRQEVAPGQTHGYLGDVEVYDEPKPSDQNTPTAADIASGHPTEKKGPRTESGLPIGQVSEADVQQAAGS